MFWISKKLKEEIASLNERLKMLEFLVNHPSKYAVGDRVKMGDQQAIVVTLEPIKKNISGIPYIPHIVWMWEYTFFYRELNETKKIDADRIPPGWGEIVKGTFINKMQK